MLGPRSAQKGGRRGSWRSPGGPCRRALQLPVHKFGVLRYPCFSTSTGAPGPGPHTVPSVVGPGPNSARARVALVALASQLRTRRAFPKRRVLIAASWGQGVRGVRDVGGTRGAEPCRHAPRRARSLFSEKGAKRPFPL